MKTPQASAGPCLASAPSSLRSHFLATLSLESATVFSLLLAVTVDHLAPVPVTPDYVASPIAVLPEHVVKQQPV